jgi:hypothetical protein
MSTIKTKQISTLPERHKKPTFTGKLQPSSSRIPQNPDVDYYKGGDDFRCPRNISSFGRQVQGRIGHDTAPRVSISTAPRFQNSETIGIGPNALGQMSAFRKQKISQRRSGEVTNFGTSTRDAALKLYAVYTCKK